MEKTNYNPAKILDPFLPLYLHERVKSEIMSAKFPWYYPAYAIDPEPDKSRVCFGTIFFDRIAEIEEWGRAPSLTYAFDHFAWSSKDWFDIETVSRCRGNMYASGQQTSPHYDNDLEDRWSLLYYVNDSDGGTTIDGIEYKHKENTAVLFDARLLHQNIPSTAPARVSVNWIIAGKFKKSTVKIR